MENKIVDKIRESIGPFLKTKEIELVEIVYRRESGKMVLRLLVDKKMGIRLGECSALNRKIGEILEELNFIDEHYILEVSSPGLDRPLKSASDFRWAMGKQVSVALNSEIEGKSIWLGEVVEVNDENVTIEAEGRKMEIPLREVVKAQKEIMV